MKRKRPETFSVTKAVKANARERVGPVPAGGALPDDKTKAARRASKHKVTLQRLLSGTSDDGTGDRA